MEGERERDERERDESRLREDALTREKEALEEKADRLRELLRQAGIDPGEE